MFPRLKIIVKDIYEIWSVDLAYMNKLAEDNMNVKYFLVAVDCLSRYLRVEPLKTKYATEFLGAFKTLCNKRKIYLYSSFSEKKSAFAEGNIRSLKTLSTSTLKKNGQAPT